MPDCLVLFKRLLWDPRVPRRRKLLVGMAIAYLAMPLDLIPDFIPVLGQIDDAIVVMLLLRHFVRASGSELVEEHWPGRPGALKTLLELT